MQAESHTGCRSHLLLLTSPGVRSEERGILEWAGCVQSLTVGVAPVVVVIASVCTFTLHMALGYDLTAAQVQQTYFWLHFLPEARKHYEPVLPDWVDDFQPKSSPKPAHFNKKQPKILTAKIMWYDFITMSIKVDKDHFYLLKIK